MGGCIKLRDDGVGGGGDGTDDGNAIKNLKFAFDLNFQIEKYRFDLCKQRLRILFDQVVVAFLRDKSAGKCHRPIPALCGDGRPVDLFKLFWLVRKFGGYEAVSRNNLWGFVSDECGLGCGVIASIKLIYMSYLNELDQWLQQVFSKRVLEDDQCGLIRKLDLLSQEVEIRFGGLFPEKKKQKQLEKHMKFAGEANDRDHITIDDFASSVGNAAAKTVNEVNGFTGGQSSDDSGTYRSEDGGETRGSANKLIPSITKLDNTDKATVNGFIRGQSSDDSRTYRSEDGGETRGSAKKLTASITKPSHAEKATVNCFIRGQSSGDSGTYCSDDGGETRGSAKKSMASITKPNHLEKATDGEERISAQSGIENMILSANDVGNVLTSRKRKHQIHSFLGMLGWLNHVAKLPDDPSVGLIPKCSKWSDYGCEEFWAQVLLVREALLIRKYASKPAGEVLKDQLKKPRMLPLLYEDDVINHQTSERLRHSKRIPLTKSWSCPCCRPSASPQTSDIIHQEGDVSRAARQRAPSEVVAVFEDKPSDMNDDEPGDVPTARKVSVGPLFQAEVPEWIGVPSSSDSKWLGTTMWPLEDGERNSMVRVDAIGKGKQHPCNCSYQDSVECVRFHVAEKRLKLKQELGLLFYQWRFNLMGEEVSLSWTEEEEKIFKDNVKSYAAFSNKFRNNTWRFLPSKPRDKLVSYYFNVYLVQRRSYQNRVTPGDVDSDDDEKDCGSIGGSFRYKALYIPRSSSISCTLNTESTEFV